MLTNREKQTRVIQALRSIRYFGRSFRFASFIESGNGGKEKVAILLNEAKSTTSEAEFKKRVKARTDIYIARHADLSKLRDILALMKLSSIMKAVTK